MADITQFTITGAISEIYFMIHSRKDSNNPNNRIAIKCKNYLRKLRAPMPQLV